MIGGAFAPPGSDREPNERERFIQALKAHTSIRVHHPEGLFDELILSDRLNLIELENVLASSVDVVVMCVESPGSFVELGAFATSHTLAPKLLVIMDRAYRKDKSFINMGPLRYLKVNKWGKVLWHRFTTPPSEHMIQQIQDFARERRAATPLPRIWKSPIRLEVLIHLLVMIYQPIAEHELLAVVDWIARDSQEEEDTVDLAIVQSISRAVIQKLCTDGSIKRELRARPNFKKLRVGSRSKLITYPTHLSLGSEWNDILALYFDHRFIPDLQKQLMEWRINAMNAMLRIER